MNRNFSKQFLYLRKWGLLALLGTLFLSGGWFLMKMRCIDMLSWGFSKAVPGIVLELKNVYLTSLHRLVVDEVVLRDQKSGKELLKMKQGTVSFTFQRLLTLKVDEIRFFEPVISVSPDMLALFSTADRDQRREKKPFPIEFTRIVCEEGGVQLCGLGNAYPEIQAKFSFDFQDFTGSAPQIKRNILLWDILAASGSPFMKLDRMEVFFSLEELGQKCLDRIRIYGGNFIVGKQMRALIQNSQMPPPALSSVAGKDSPAPGQTMSSPSSWVVNQVNISEVNVAVEDENLGMSRIQFQLSTQLKSMTLQDAANNLSSVTQTVELSHLSLMAPSGKKVMTFPTIFVQFTLQDLLREQIDEVVILTPTIYLNEDLFAYMNSISSLGTPAGNPPTSSGWAIHKLRVDRGNLIIGASEDEGVGLPVKFETSIHNITLQNLAALKINGQLLVPEEKYEFASYQLEFKSKSGEMYFSYPPEKGNNNIVTVFKLSHLRWRQYQFQEPWLGVTFDEKGINGTFGGKAYKGYVSGGFSFFFRNNSPWIGWVGGRKLDLYQLTQLISPKDFTMTGSLDLAIQVNAQGPSIERIKGSIDGNTPGQVHVEKIQNLLKDLPGEWSTLKRSATTVALETLQDFEYKKVDGDFWFVDSQGIVNFNLLGPTGSRNLKFVIHTNPYSSYFSNPSAGTLQ